MKKIRTERWRFARWLVGCALALGVALPCRAAVAEPAEARALARSYFDRGLALSKQRAYAEALAEFQRAYAASPHFSVLYNIGQAEVALGRSAEAIATLQRYLEQGGAELAAARRAEVEAVIARELARTGTIEVEVDRAGALISVDQTPYGRSPLPAPLRVNAGAHRVAAALDSGERRELVLDVPPQQNVRARFELMPAPAPAAGSPAASALAPAAAGPAPAAAAPAPPHGSASPARVPAAPAPVAPAPAPAARPKTLAYVVGAAGIALSGAALAHFLWNRGRYRDWQQSYASYYRDPTDTQREQANRLSDSIDRASMVTLALSVGAGLSLGTSAVLLLTGERAPAARGAGQQLSPLLSLRGQF